MKHCVFSPLLATLTSKRLSGWFIYGLIWTLLNVLANKIFHTFSGSYQKLGVIPQNRAEMDVVFQMEFTGGLSVHAKIWFILNSQKNKNLSSVFIRCIRAHPCPLFFSWYFCQIWSQVQIKVPKIIFLSGHCELGFIFLNCMMH